MTQYTARQIYDAFIAHDNKADAARYLGMPRRTFGHRLKVAMAELGLSEKSAPIASGKVDERPTRVLPVPTKGEVRRYIVTCAQNNTKVNVGVWENLTALAEHYGAELLVSRITYNKQAYHGWRPKPDTETPDDMGGFGDLWYDPAILPHVCDERLQLAPGLVFCGEVDILPTAVRPLSGFETYTGRKSGIFPHPKLAMDSIASGKHEGTKFNFTTGTVTLRNYIQRKAGQKAEFHHCYGALVVEVDGEGDWFVRQLNAGADDSIYDLDLRAHIGEVTAGHRLEAVTWGDIHVRQIDPVVDRVCWDKGGLLDRLRPKHQFFHDLVDWRARNHHDRKNPHRMFERYVRNEDGVEDELADVSRWMHRAHREWCTSVVVDSNHDRAFERWLREADYREDPRNAVFFLEAQLEKYLSIKRGDSGFHLIEWSLRSRGCPKEAVFLDEDESFIICHDRSGGIECGMHGHLGPNGARGTPRGLSKMGRKANTGHTHSAGIIDGLFTAGGSSVLDMGFNSGPSSWSHSLIGTYENGKRTIVTIWNGKAHAAR
jgi:hypothetical protein